MFAGIVSGVGEVVEVVHGDQSARIQISCLDYFAESKIGDSICVSGVCLTAVDLTGSSASFDVSSETLRKTRLSDVSIRKFVNLEKSLKLGDRIDGHLVYGHVDGCLEIVDISQEGPTWKFVYQVSKDIIKYFPIKGSVSIDGVSLTIGDVINTNFSTYIIPHTYENTIFKKYEIGSLVNYEIDPIARYVQSAFDNFANHLR